MSASEQDKQAELLLLCQLFYPELVSTGQTLTELCEVLSEKGTDIEVLAGPPTYVDTKSHVPKRIEHHGIRIKRVPGTRFPKLNFVGRVINSISYAFFVFVNLLLYRKKRPVIVLTNPPFLALACAMLRMVGLGNPYIYLIFDVYPDTAIKQGLLKKTGLISRLWEFCNKLAFKHASIILVIGRCMQEIVSEKTKKLGLDVEDRFRCIHIWSDDKLIRSAEGKENPYIAKWNVEGKFVVSYSGNMGRFHDMETIMEAARILQPNEDIVFLFIGEGAKKAPSKAFAEKWNLDNCQFHTYVDREDLGFSMSLASVGLVSLAREQEGLSVPSKTFGIMAAGVPTIAIVSPFSEIARMLQEEACGRIVASGDAQALADTILHLYRHEEDRKQMGDNARRAIETKYNLGNAAESYFELLSELSA